MTATTEILDLVRRWAAAEQQNDPGLLDGVLADDFQGPDNSGRFRLTLVAVRPDDRWRVANVHIGPLRPAGPPSS